MREFPECCWPEWEIIEKIGSGSFGEVYKIRRVEDGKEYFDALKIIRIPKEPGDVDTVVANGVQDVNGYYEKYVENIFHEIDTMIQLGGNTNIVDYKDHKKIKRKNEVGYDIYIRMELLTSLLEYRKSHEMNRDEILQMGIDICKALELCEKRNIVHRDIKPENIFINEYGDYELGDFGISRTLDSATVGTIAGTMNYMAPEIYKHETFDGTVDIYSLGLVLYNFLNKGLPFMPSLPGEAIARRMKGEPLPPIRGASKELSDIICKACSYDPKNRYPNATSFCRALEAVKAGIKMPVIPQMTSSDQTMIVDTTQGWTCSCGQVNHTEFCTNCGQRRSTDEEPLEKIAPVSSARSITSKPSGHKWLGIVVAVFLVVGIGGFGITRWIGSKEYPKQYVTGCQTTLKVYEEADRDSKVLYELSNRDEVSVISDANSAYYEIEGEGQKKKGYVDPHYLTDSLDAVTQPLEEYVNDEEIQYLYEEADPQSDILASVKKGDPVTILAKPAGDYYYVYNTAQDAYGYIEKDLLTEEKPSTEKKKKETSTTTDQRIFGSGPAPKDYTGPYYVNVQTGYLALRTAKAFDSSNEIGKMYNGDYVYAIEKTGTYWYVYAPSLGMYGYTNADYLLDQPKEKQTADASGNVYYANVKTGYLALRSAMAYDYANEIGQIQNGQAVEVLDTDTGTEYWYVYVPSLDQNGYVNSHYLSK